MDAAFIWNLSKLGRIGSRRLQFDDDFADRLNYQYTSVMLFMFIGLIGVRQYVGKPIQCWIPQEFTRGWEEYAENYCWVANTYFAPVQDRLPPTPDRRELLLVYYQWAPIVMAAQALLFYLPCLTWRLGMARSGFNLHRILQMASNANEMEPETASKTVDILSHYIRSCIQRRSKHVISTSTKVGNYSRLTNESLHGIVPRVPKRNPEQAPRTMKRTSAETHRTGKPGCAGIEQQVVTTTAVVSTTFENLERQSTRTRKPAPAPPLAAKSTTTAKNFQATTTSFDEKSSIPETASVNGATPKQITTISEPSKPTIRWPWCGCKHGNYLVYLYMTVKLCYLFNVVGQIYLMQSFIGTKYTSYGARVLMDLVQGREWHQSGHFPRVTFCDLEAKKLGKNHVYTLQCVLPLNMFLEKIYIFLWFWHVGITFITLMSLFVWLYRLFHAHARATVIRNHLNSIEIDCESTDQVHKFIDHYLGLDGLFIIILISSNSGGILASDLVGDLWLSYKNAEYVKQRGFERHHGKPELDKQLTMNSPMRTHCGMDLMALFRTPNDEVVFRAQDTKTTDNTSPRCFLPGCFHTFRRDFVDTCRATPPRSDETAHPDFRQNGQANDDVV